MEKGLKCQAEDCGNKADYFHSNFKVYICSLHCKSGQRGSCIKLEDRSEFEGVTEILKVLQTCIKNLMIAMESCKNDEESDDSGNLFSLSSSEDSEESKLNLSQVQNKITQIVKRVNTMKQKQQFQVQREVKQKLKDLFSELKSDETFKKFCVENYIAFVCDFLKVSKFKVGEVFDFEININNEANFKELETKIDAKYDSLKQEFQKFKEDVVTTLNPTTLKGLSHSYKVFTKKKNIIEKNSELVIDLEDSSNLEFIECMGSNILANLETLKIFNIKNKMPVVKDFIFSSFPQQANRFHLNCGGSVINSDQIIDVVCYMNPKIAETLYLYNLEVGQIQMRTLFQLTKDNKKFLGFPCCKLELDTVPNLQHCLIRSKIQTLALSYCGKPEYCDWRNHPERFENLIKGLSQSEDFKKNLKSLHMTQCGMAKYKIQQILDSNGFEKVKIEHHSE
ncbi:unnamed protein product [Moneuplotes crassus]|uniref:Uncharacterized protein n=1 Tax=Euplotes crassus TaxID=5936 RepID=A0AAD1XA81_EUPCR|nr:unnamed protein product [Moneuplotes crassus]